MSSFMGRLLGKTAAIVKSILNAMWHRVWVPRGALGSRGSAMWMGELVGYVGVNVTSLRLILGWRWKEFQENAMWAVL